MTTAKMVPIVLLISAFTYLSAPTVVTAASDPSKEAGVMKDRIIEHKHGPHKALSPHLVRLYERTRKEILNGERQKPSAAVKTMNRLMRASSGYVTIDIIAKDDPVLLHAELEARGMRNVEVFGMVISGRLPVTVLPDMAASVGVQSISPAMALTNAGLTTSQGDVAQRSDEARQILKVKGRKVRVGVLSDSFNCLSEPLLPGNPFTTAEDDLGSGDLMKDIVVLKDLDCEDGGEDEGRAMLQIIRDVAPRADGAFHTAGNGKAGFANGILRLASKARSDVIVDDIIYLDEPMFQDGIVAQAVDMVVAMGVPYFSAAGNDARQSWEGRFRSSGKIGQFGTEHSFGGKDRRQTMRISPGAVEYLSFQWTEPYRSAGPLGSASDLDIYFYDKDGNALPDCDAEPPADVCQYAGASDNIGGDPIEIAVVQNGTRESIDVQIGIEIYEGPAPVLMKYVYFDMGKGGVESLEYATNSSTIYGHSNARGAEAVGAAAWFRTSEWGNPLGNAAECTPACLNYFSSAGGMPIYFDNLGRQLRRPEVRVKPGITGPDGGNTTFFYSNISHTIMGANGKQLEPDGFPNFFGTSAAAPHLAAVAALMLEASDLRFDPSHTYSILRSTASDMRFRYAGSVYDGSLKDIGRSYDRDSGFGFVDAYRAVCEAAEYDHRRTNCRR